MSEVGDERVYGKVGGFSKKISKIRTRGRRREVREEGGTGIQ